MAHGIRQGMACASAPLPNMCGNDDANDGVAWMQGKKMRPTLVEFSNPLRLVSVARRWRGTGDGLQDGLVLTECETLGGIPVSSGNISS